MSNTGDLFVPGATKTFGWDLPVMSRDEDNMIMKVALGCLDTQDGMDTTRFLVLKVGNSVRLSPHKLGIVVNGQQDFRCACEWGEGGYVR